jgi:hypothetical protein
MIRRLNLRVLPDRELIGQWNILVGSPRQYPSEEKRTADEIKRRFGIEPHHSLLRYDEVTGKGKRRVKR